MNKPVYLCYIDTGSFIVYTKTEEICADIAKNVKARFDTSNYGLDEALPKEKKKKVIGLMKNELDGKMIKEFFALRTKPYSYLTYNNDGRHK